MTEREMEKLAKLIAKELRKEPLLMIDVTPALDADVKEDHDDDGLTDAQREQLERRDAAMARAGREAGQSFSEAVGGDA